MSETAQPTCVFPPCAEFDAPADSPVGRLCRSCGRPLGGPRFGREPGYRFDGYLGSGYFADVFRARDLGSGLAYAVKIYGDAPRKRHAWTRETVAFRALGHRRLPALKEAFDEGGRLFVVMELVEGTSLRQEVETHGPLPPERAVKLGIEVGEALEYIASRGWTYRDLHPRNIHVDTPKGAMLLDLDGARPPGWPGRPAGRAGYRAPELAMERSVSTACDTYSLVGCLYFALLGDDPSAEPGPLPELRGPLGPFPGVADLLDAGRRADPNQRPGVGTIRAALRLLVSSEG
jgi:serine/threonine protein kinase